MKRQQIIAILALLAVGGAGGATYQFYFKERLDQYGENQRYLASLQEKKAQFERDFGKGKNPEAVIEAFKNKVQPWAEAAEDRAKYYNIRQYAKVDPIPDNVIVKAYYSEKATTMTTQLYGEAYAKGISLGNIDYFFGQPTPDQLVSTTINKEEAFAWLRNIQFGSSLVRLLMANGAIQINDLRLWPTRVEPGVCHWYTFGASMWIQMGNLCAFLEKLQNDSQSFFSVHAFRIQTPQLRSYDNPPLLVDILISLGDYEGEKEAAAKGTQIASAGEATSQGATEEPEDLSNVLQKLRESRRD